MKKFVVLLAVLAMVLGATSAYAQDPNFSQGENLQQDAGDNTVGGKVVGDDTPDCASASDVLESGLCKNGASLNSHPSTQTDVDHPVDQPSSPAGSLGQYDQYLGAGQYQGLLPETGGISPTLFGVVLLAIGLILFGLFIKEFFGR